MTISPETYNLRRKKLGVLFSDLSTDDSDDHHSYCAPRHSDGYSNPSSGCSSPNLISSPWSHPSPYTKSPWIHQIVPSSLPGTDHEPDGNSNSCGSFFREEGHVYSIAAATGGLLYTGSDSKNVRVWKDLKEFSGFKSSSGLVKAIVVFGDKVFTGHQDGKIRVWKYLGGNAIHKRVGNLPTTRDLIFKSIDPRSYAKARRRRWVKHYDAVSCLSVDSAQGFLYSGSWDKTIKVWRIVDSRCVESIRAHDDAVNAVVVGFDGLVFTASADGTVKAWRRELVGRMTEHVLVETLLRQDSAMTSLAVSGRGLYAGSSDGFVSFWEREKHFMTYGGVLRGHKLAVLCMAAGGDLVMSGSSDESICVWRREGGGGHTCLAVLTGHTGPVKCLSVEEDDDDDDKWIVYSGSLDKSVKVWRVSACVRELEGNELTVRTSYAPATRRHMRWWTDEASGYKACDFFECKRLNRHESQFLFFN